MSQSDKQKNCSSSEPNSKAIARRHFVHCAHARNLCSSHMVGAHFQTCVKMRENVTHEFHQFCQTTKKTSTRGPHGHHKSHQQVCTSDLCKTSFFFFADAWILTLPCSRMKRVAAVLPCWTTGKLLKFRIFLRCRRCRWITHPLPSQIAVLQPIAWNCANNSWCSSSATSFKLKPLSSSSFLHCPLSEFFTNVRTLEAGGAIFCMISSTMGSCKKARQASSSARCREGWVRPTKRRLKSDEWALPAICLFRAQSLETHDPQYSLCPTVRSTQRKISRAFWGGLMGRTAHQSRASGCSLEPAVPAPVAWETSALSFLSHLLATAHFLIYVC